MYTTSALIETCCRGEVEVFTAIRNKNCPFDPTFRRRAEKTRCCLVAHRNAVMRLPALSVFFDVSSNTIHRLQRVNGSAFSLPAARHQARTALLFTRYNARSEKVGSSASLWIPSTENVDFPALSRTVREVTSGTSIVSRVVVLRATSSALVSLQQEFPEAIATVSIGSPCEGVDKNRLEVLSACDTSPLYANDEVIDHRSIPLRDGSRMVIAADRLHRCALMTLSSHRESRRAIAIPVGDWWMNDVEPKLKGGEFALEHTPMAFISYLGGEMPEPGRSFTDLGTFVSEAVTAYEAAGSALFNSFAATSIDVDNGLVLPSPCWQATLLPQAHRFAAVLNRFVNKISRDKEFQTDLSQPGDKQSRAVNRLKDKLLAAALTVPEESLSSWLQRIQSQDDTLRSGITQLRNIVFLCSGGEKIWTAATCS